jgi:hypothetical protein
MVNAIKNSNQFLKLVYPIICNSQSVPIFVFSQKGNIFTLIPSSSQRMFIIFEAWEVLFFFIFKSIEFLCTKYH